MGGETGVANMIFQIYVEIILEVAWRRQLYEKGFIFYEDFKYVT